MLTADLRILSGKHEGKVISLTTKKFLIGRGEDCHMRPNNDLVSRHHCVFTLDEYSVRLRDLGSTNGTHVNDEPLKGQTVLNTGDKIRIGKLEFSITVKEGAPVAAEVASEPGEPLELSGETISESDQYEDSESDGDSTGTETIHDLSDSPTDTQMMNEGDTQFFPPQQQYPGQQPLQYAPGSMPPGYGYPQMPGYPPQMPMGQFPYPQMPGYPQQYQMPGYPQGYPMPNQQMPGYPQQQQPQQQQPQYQQPQYQQPQPEQDYEVEEEEPSANKKSGSEIPVKLPDPSETGAKEEAKVENAGRESAGKSFAEENPSSKAGDIIQQYMRRRPS
ncbi:FHA domain-containing protein [Rubinisphaera italica]|uniref:FHA domain-containing protein FhaA n=1 Tax=Rubinisphaera italica TaxID=2527969 RepID=A0A5C5XHA5_9PLAN|nr:FHA domain-containing protein [Rubinisphaera italica]TWT62546.1 FHA domain-containing protein FhaA [Rubinisphaera italica]